MEEITKTAKTYYANLSETEKQSVIDSFKKIDINGDGTISSEEYHRRFKRGIFFEMLDRDKSGTLDFDEFITLQYLRISERCICQGCKLFPAGTYFTCVPCFEASGYRFDLCCDCYGNKIDHEHSVFLDNHTLLEAMRKKNKDSENVKDKPVQRNTREVQFPSSMEEITDIAKAYYENLSDEQKQSAIEFFKTIDINGDGTISSEEYHRRFEKGIFFEMLDIDKNGMLDFEEFITLQYLYTSKRVLCICQGCKRFPAGTYFTCVPCFENASGNMFDLCCDCYGKIHHEHSEFLDTQTLLYAMRKKNKDSENVKDKPVQRNTREVQFSSSMEEITNIAQAYYENLSDEQKQSAIEFFKTMDINGDGTISLEEFERYYESNSYTHFFHMVDKDKNGMLDFDEFITLLYLRTSRRRICTVCRLFPAGTYFTCVTCFENASGNPVVLCCDCYRNKKSDHEHSVFLDNHTLLQAMRDKNKDSEKVKEIVKYVEIPVVKYVNAGNQSASLQLAVSGAKIASSSLKIASHATSAVNFAANIASFCTIM